MFTVKVKTSVSIEADLVTGVKIVINNSVLRWARYLKTVHYHCGNGFLLYFSLLHTKKEFLRYSLPKILKLPKRQRGTCYYRIKFAVRTRSFAKPLPNVVLQ